MENVDSIFNLGGGYFRIGLSTLVGELQPNVYVLVDEKEAILFGSGPQVLQEGLIENLQKCISGRILHTIVIHGEEPGSSSALSYFQKEGIIAHIAAHWRTWNQMRFYGLTMEPYIIDEHNWSLQLSSGRVLQFLPTPYLYQPGAIATYDRTAKTLLTGMLFSSYSTDFSLFEDKGFMERLKRFHQVNMPSRELLAPAAEFLGKREIEHILPSYGSVIRGDIEKIVREISALECGELAVSRPFQGLHADAAQPSSAFAEIASLKREVQDLRKLNEELTQSVAVSKDRAIRDAVTGLFSETFFKSFIEEEAALRIDKQGQKDQVLGILGIDRNLAQIEFKYGSGEIEALLRGVAENIRQNLPPTAMGFRLHGATMAVWIPEIVLSDAIDIFDKIRYEIEISKSFVEPITISIGVATLAETRKESTDFRRIASAMSDIGIRRLRIALRKGGNTVNFATTEENEAEDLARLLIVDDDTVNVDVLKTYFINQGYAILTASDGQEALSILEKEIVDIVITELMVPKIDAYLLKESMLSKSSTKDIPVIVISHLKTETTIRRTYRLGIFYYLQKPIILEELLGIVENITKTGNGP